MRITQGLRTLLRVGTPALRAALLCALSVCVASAASTRPNILILLADDLGYADVGFAGGTQIKTPNIDKLAARGARLDQYYVQPLCSPTRAALMTGRYPIRYGLQVGVILPYEKRGLSLDETTLPENLRSAGYETAIVGKWHLGQNAPEYLPLRRGFMHQYGHYNGEIDYFKHERMGGFDWHRDDQVCRDEGYSTHLIAKEATRLLKTFSRDKPFFLYVPFNAVHIPLQVPEEYKRPYASLPEPRRTYAGITAAMDEAVGNILTALDETGHTTNTLVLFSSDNGGPAPGRITDNGKFKGGKGGVYEGGTRVCACVAWPGQIKPGSAIKSPCHVVDWYPTLLKQAGITMKQKPPLDGHDISSLLTGKPGEPDREILINASHNAGALRKGDWKLVVKAASSGDEESEGEEKAAKKKKVRAATRETELVQLYNLAADPGETHDLATEHPDKVKELRGRYDSYLAAAVKPANVPRPENFVAPKVWGETPLP